MARTPENLRKTSAGGRRAWPAAILVALGLVAFGLKPMPEKPPYPPARVADVVDDYHGTKVADPYRWLEDPDSEETKAFVAAQNRLTENYLASYPDRKKIKDRLTQLWNYPKYSVPRKEGGRYFYWKNEGLKNQPELFVQDGLSAEPKLAINPNELSKDGAVAVTEFWPSHDGKLIAYAISRSGSDRQEIKVRDLAAAKDREDFIPHCRFTDLTWRHDGAGFFYNRYPEPGTVPPADETMFNRVYFHRLGAPAKEDRLVFERPDDKELGFWPFITDDGQYLCLDVQRGTDPKNDFYYRKTDADDANFVRLLDQFDGAYRFIDNVGEVFYFQTDFKAPRSRVIAIDLKDPGRDKWREIVPQQPDPLVSAAIVNQRLVLVYARDVVARMELRDLSGKLEREIALPDPGAVAAVAGRRLEPELFFGFESFLHPYAIYRYDFDAAKLVIFRGPQLTYRPEDYQTTQVFYASKDGTRVPMFIVHRKDHQPDGKSPALLYGYGGFNVSLTPFFSISRLIWLEAGGVWAVANLRGGDEYGEDWHQAGMLEKKQNVFDDFIAAGEWLIKNQWADPRRLAISGGSNGGLLVAACVVQRPDLYGAAVAMVPLTDMLRYQKFTVGHFWVPEYGAADQSPQAFKYLFAYSPLHNVKPGVKYPPLLITTADTDDRVAPLHAKKFAATLQAQSPDSWPILLRVETKAGHGAGKPTQKAIDEGADINAFLMKVFAMTPGK